ncbi:hypothetical protein ACPEIF_33720 [Streptomyces sp. NPDC012600]|uniref:hypothetical protein n=1 Tax=Streptomycetaceae TaxID=2062 RepID=UPI00131EA56E
MTRFGRGYISVLGGIVLAGSLVVNPGSAVAEENPAVGIVDSAKISGDSGEEVTTGQSYEAAGSDVEAFGADIAAALGLRLAGAPIAEVYEGLDRTLTLHLVDGDGNNRLTVTRVKVDKDVPKSVFADDEESVKTQLLPDGGTLAVVSDGQSNRVGVLSPAGVLTFWDSTTFNGESPIAIGELTDAARSLAAKHDGVMEIGRAGATAKPSASAFAPAAAAAAARPKCKVTWNNLFIANRTPNVFASTSLQCDQAGDGALGAYVQQYRGSGIWVGVAGYVQAEKNKKLVTVIPNYTCRAWSANDKKQYRAAALLRQLKNKNGTWFGQNMINGPAKTFKCK